MSETSTTVARICLIGAGRMGMMRLRLFIKAKAIECIAVVELAEKPTDQIHKLFPSIPVYSSLSQVHEQFDGVWIATPTQTHFEQILEAAERAKFIYCEQPIARTERIVKRCYETCAQMDVDLFCSWVRRFDPDYNALVEATRDDGNAILSGQLTIKEYPRPDGSLLRSRGGLFHDLMSVDLNFVAMLVDEQVPVSIQAASRDTHAVGIPDSAVCTLQFPRGRSYFLEAGFGVDHYASRIRVVTKTGTLDIGRDATAEDVHERFSTAFAREVDYFGAILRGEDVVRVCLPEHCILTARIVDMATESSTMGHRVFPTGSLRLVQIGVGRFGTYIHQNVLPRLSNCEIVSLVNTKNNSELELDMLFSRKDVEAVYVCTPYRHHAPLVLCEKPLLDLPKLQKLAIKHDRLLMIGFQRRFDAEYIKAKTYIKSFQRFSSITLESHYTLPPTNDHLDLIYSGLADDLDTVAWLLDELDNELSVKSVKISGQTVSCVVTVWLKQFDRTVEAQLKYTRSCNSTIQRVTIDDHIFGYEIKSSGPSFSTYREAYAKQLAFFAKQQQMSDQGNFCLTYTTTHELICAALEKLLDDLDEEYDDKATFLRKHLASSLDPTAKIRTPALEVFKTVAGHGGTFFCDDRIYKPLLNEENEWHIYNRIRECVPELRKSMPKIYDRVVIDDVPYIVMKNLTHGCVKPKVFDLKVGESSDFQRLHNQPYGIKVAGYSGDNIPRRAMQSWNDIVTYFKDFIKDRDTNASRYQNIPRWLKRLKQIQTILERQTSFRFRAASLLFVYDAIEHTPRKPTVHLIDMARTIELPEYRQDHEEGESSEGWGKGGLAPPFSCSDHFLCFGIKNVKKILEEIHKKFVSRHAVFLCRHGFRLDYNDLDWVPNAQYPHDPPLSEDGLRQARDVAKRLKYENIEMIVTSPFSRALQTAKTIAENCRCKFVVEPALAEFMSVTNRRNIPTLDPEQYDGVHPLKEEEYTRVGDWLTLENWEGMCDRVYTALSKITLKYKRVCIVSHRSTFQALLSVILGDKFKQQLEFCSLSSILPSGNEAGWQVDCLNSYGHLRGSYKKSPEHNPNYRAGISAYKDMITGADGKVLPSGFN